MSFQPSRPADKAVKDRKRGKLAGAGPKSLNNKSLNKPQNGGPQQAAVPDPGHDIEAVQFEADTIPVFCKKYRFSVALYYKMKLLGKMPRELRIGDRVLISKEAAEEWRKAREAATAADPAQVERRSARAHKAAAVRKANAERKAKTTEMEKTS